MTAPKRIFLIQTAFFGDVVLSTPVVRAVKDLYPEAELDLVLIPATEVVYRHNPHVRQIYLFDKRDPLKRWPSFLKLARLLRARRYDLAISLHVSFASSLLLRLSGARERLGYPRQKFTTRTIELPKGVPVVKRGLLLLKALSDRQFSPQTELFIPAEVQGQVDAFIRENSLDPQKLVGLAPGSVWATKRWLPRYFSQVLSGLAEQGFQPVLIGGKDDSALCAGIIADSRARAVNAAGQLSLLGSAWLIKNCRLLITNDSAPLHLANAVQTPVLAIFGPTVERFGFFPCREGDRVLETELDCRPCGKHGHQRCPRGHFNCMARITPEAVLRNALEMLL